MGLAAKTMERKELLKIKVQSQKETWIRQIEIISVEAKGCKIALEG